MMTSPWLDVLAAPTTASRRITITGLNPTITTITYFVFLIHSCSDRLNYATHDVMLTVTPVSPRMHNKNEEHYSLRRCAYLNVLFNIFLLSQHVQI
jgi:hypothetical protein